MFYLNKDKELSEELLQKIINRFKQNELPKLQKWANYYDGKHKILQKTYKDKDKVCNRIVTNYCKIITDTYAGYIAGKPITYTSNEDISVIQDVINYNDSAAADMSWLKNALIFKRAYELQWVDEQSQNRYAQVNPMNAFVIYDDTLDCNLLYFVRWYEVDTFDDTTLYHVQVYNSEKIKTYKCTSLGSSLTFLEEKKHYYKDVPVSVFDLNDTDDNIFNSVITLNDAYNELVSCEIDDFSAWCDAYLTLSGADMGTEELAEMKEGRVLILPEGAQANWLTKNANDTQIENMLSNIKENIFKVTACPDMADENFLAQSGTALAYKLVGFENLASVIVANFTKALQRRIELVSNIISVKGTDTLWRDIQINFVRNLPVNITETIQLVNSLKGIVSDATLLAQIPFITDVEAELEAVKLQKEENMAIFDFGSFDTDTDDTEDNKVA